MSTEIILMYAIGVFVLMCIGIILTMIEFNKLTDDPSIRKGSGGPEKKTPASGKAKMRIVDSNENAA
jgi:hypothetical protein